MTPEEERQEQLKRLASSGLYGNQGPIDIYAPVPGPYISGGGSTGGWTDAPKPAAPAPEQGWAKPKGFGSYDNSQALGAKATEQDSLISDLYKQVQQPLTSTTTSSAKETAASRAAYQSLMGATADAVAAAQALGDAQAKAAKARANATEALVNDQAGALQKETSKRDQVMAAIDKRVQEDAKAREELLNMKVDPAHLWSSANAFNKGMMAIGLALGTAAKALSQGRLDNDALMVIDRAIERDIDAQKANLSAKQFKYNAQRNALYDLQHKLGSVDRGIDLLRGMHRDEMANKLQIFADRTSSPTIKAVTEAKVADLRANGAQATLQYRSSLIPRTQTTVRDNQEGKMALLEAALKGGKAKETPPDVKQRMTAAISTLQGLAKLQESRSKYNMLGKAIGGDRDAKSFAADLPEVAGQLAVVNGFLKPRKDAVARAQHAIDGGMKFEDTQVERLGDVARNVNAQIETLAKMNSISPADLKAYQDAWDAYGSRIGQGGK